MGNLAGYNTPDEPLTTKIIKKASVEQAMHMLRNKHVYKLAPNVEVFEHVMGQLL